MRIGFIGLGHMGRGMAANLLKARHEVIVFNRTAGKAGELEAAGATVAADVGEACDAEAVFTMLSNDEAVEGVVYAPSGILETLPKNAIHISSSTISVALSERLAKAHRDVGQRYVAATVLGRPDAAAAGKLFVIAAGAPSALAEI